MSKFVGAPSRNASALNAQPDRLAVVTATEASDSFERHVAIDCDEFAAAMAALARPESSALAVAVSGGADSMALALLLDQWCRDRGVTLHAFTVDHRLRAEATGEAAQVATWLGARGLKHDTLVWDDGAARATLAASAQADARDARYRLLIEACRTRGISDLALAHHADDQVETFLMRLARGSGLDGLTAMAPVAVRNGARLIRPLLGFAKVRLEATCRAAGQLWISDPSNADRSYARARFRQAREILAAEGLSNERLLATITHLRRAQSAIESSIAALAERALAVDRHGAFIFQAAAFCATAEEVSLRLLARVLTAAAGADYGPRFEKLVRLHDRLRRDIAFRATLAGCEIERSGGLIRISREVAAITDERAIAPGQSIVWDGRFRVTWAGVRTIRPAMVVRLQNEHWLTIKPTAAGAAMEHLPVRVRQTLPAVVRDGVLLAVPHGNHQDFDVSFVSNVEFHGGNPSDL